MILAKNISYSYSRLSIYNDSSFSIIKGEKVALVGKLLDKESFDKLSIPFSAVTTDFITAEPFIIQSGNLT